MSGEALWNRMRGRISEAEEIAREVMMQCNQPSSYWVQLLKQAFPAV